MRIKKTSETTPVAASVVNQKNNSTTDAYSCDYVNKIEEWSKLTASGTTSVALPQDYKEIRVIVKNSTYQNWFVGTFTKDCLTDIGDAYYRVGHYQASNDNSACAVRIKNDLVQLASAYVNSSAVSSGCTVYVYYR